MTYDLIIRNGTIVDGLGGEPYVGDVAVRDGVIQAVGHVNGDTARREIDASGLLVTPCADDGVRRCDQMDWPS